MSKQTNYRKVHFEIPRKPTKRRSENSISLACRTEYTLDANPKPHISPYALLHVRSAKRRAAIDNTNVYRRKQIYKHPTPLRTAVIP
jgi:hypothetical protein